MMNGMVGGFAPPNNDWGGSDNLMAECRMREWMHIMIVWRDISHIFNHICDRRIENFQVNL